MKKFLLIMLALAAATMVAVATFAIVRIFTAAITPPTTRAVCLQSHREVVMIPTICGEHDVCQKPIVAEVCERIESPAPQPLLPSSGADDDE